MPPSKRTKEESIAIRDEIVAWALTPTPLREHKTTEALALHLGVSKQYVGAVSRLAPKDLSSIRRQIRGVMIGKALQGDVAAARYVDTLAAVEQEEKASKRTESKEDRTIRKAVERFPHNAPPAPFPAPSVIPAEPCLVETRETYERAGVTAPARAT